MKKSKGFSLIEVLAAFAILSIAILPIMSMYPTVLKMDRKSRGHEEGARLAFTMVDYIKSKGYANLMQTGTANVTTFITGKNYTDIAKIPGESYYSSDSFCNDFNISSNLFILNSKSLNLSEVNIWIGLHKSIAKLGDEHGHIVTNPAIVKLYSTTQAGIGHINNNIIVGRVVVGWGDTANVNHLTGKEKEYSIQFIVTRLEK